MSLRSASQGLAPNRRRPVAAAEVLKVLRHSVVPSPGLLVMHSGSTVMVLRHCHRMVALPAPAEMLCGVPRGHDVTPAGNQILPATTPSPGLPPFARCHGLNNLRSPLSRSRRIHGGAAAAGGADVEAVS